MKDRKHDEAMFQISEADEAALDISCRDPRDNNFLVLALACSADVLVSSDDDLLTLNPYGDIQVLTPKAYLADSSHCVVFRNVCH